MARRLTAGLLAAAAVLAGCGTPRAPVTPGVVKVVAGETFWGNIAAQIGGPHVQVTLILSSPGTDPHMYSRTWPAPWPWRRRGWSSPTGRPTTI